MKDLYTLELFEQLVREHRLAHNKFTERQLAEAIRQMILAGDFERHVNAHQQKIVYIPYARQLALEMERDTLRKRIEELERHMKNIAQD